MLLMLLLLKYNLGMVESLLKVHWLSSFVLLLDRGRVVVEEAEETIVSYDTTDIIFFALNSYIEYLI